MPFTKRQYYETGESSATGGYGETHFGGQTFTPEVAHTIVRVGFKAFKNGSPTGDGYIDLYNCDQGTSLPTGGRLARATYNTADITGTSESPAWFEVDLDSGVALSQGTEYALISYQPNSDVSNLIKLKSDYPNPTYTRGVMLFSSTGFENLAAFSDNDYQFREYSGWGGEGTTPTVTTQAVTDATPSTVTGNGNITSSGNTVVTQHGHVWSTSANPTTSDSKTENGAAPNTGPFTSAITGLTPGTLYYFRAYAINSEGTSYGSDVTTTTGTAIGKRYIWTEGTNFHYFDAYGTERVLQGHIVASDKDILPWLDLFS